MEQQENTESSIEIPAKGFVCFMPWLRLPCWVGLKDFKFIRYPDPEGIVPQIQFLDRLFSSYRDSYGDAVPDVTLVIKEESPLGWNISEEDYSEIRRISKLLFLCGLSAVEFYNPMSSYCCSSQFATIGQRFQVEMDGPALTNRRKDGTSSSIGPTFGQLHFINPPHYSTNHDVKLDIDLLVAVSIMYASDSCNRPIIPRLFRFQ